MLQRHHQKRDNEIEISNNTQAFLHRTAIFKIPVTVNSPIFIDMLTIANQGQKFQRLIEILPGAVPNSDCLTLINKFFAFAHCYVYRW